MTASAAPDPPQCGESIGKPLLVSLEILSGPRAGETINVSEGGIVTVGRGTNANFPLPEDTFLSRVHFAVERTADGVRLIDRKSANGTSLNNSRLTEPVLLNDGDLISAGQSTFKVKLFEVPPTPGVDLAALTPRPIEQAVQPGTLAMGSWFFAVIPQGWTIVDGIGLRSHERHLYPSDAAITETTLAGGQTLGQYAEAQLEVVRMLVSQPQVEPAESPEIAGAEEAKSFLVRYTGDGNRRFIQRQIYVRHGDRAGSLSLTAPEDEAPAVAPFLDQIVRGASFCRLG